jgi:hypothetical protein
MKQSRFTARKIISIHREADAGVKVVELRRKHGMWPRDGTRRWKHSVGAAHAAAASPQAPASTCCCADGGYT